MVFVTVGTHEQPFNRLIKEIDNLKAQGIINEPVFIQTGFSNYKPHYCNWQKFVSVNEMNSYMKKARIIICHGGPTFLESLKLQKIPIVVPRQLKYNEHVNNHQVNFVRFIFNYNKNIIPIYNINSLKNVIINYDGIIQNLNTEKLQHNEQFNKKFSEIVKELFKKEK